MHAASEEPRVPEFSPCAPRDFCDAIQPVIDRWEGYLTRYTYDDYAVMRLYLDAAKHLTGFAIKQSGELVSVFNRGERGNGRYAIQYAILQGATHLDAVDGFLREYYEGLGFEVYRTEKNYVEGQPDIVFMRVRSEHLPIPYAVLTPEHIESQRLYLRDVEGLPDDQIEQIVKEYLHGCSNGMPQHIRTVARSVLAASLLLP
jgi:hypothetical protein